MTTPKQPGLAEWDPSLIGLPSAEYIYYWWFAQEPERLALHAQHKSAVQSALPPQLSHTQQDRLLGKKVGADYNGRA